MIEIVFRNLPQVQEWLASLPSALHTALVDKSATLADALQQKVVQKLSGDVLQSKSGLLRDSIETAVEENSDGVSASVFVGGDVPYAAIQEYGGITKAHIIQATHARALAFDMNGKTSFFTYVNHPGSNIPARPYLSSSLADMNDDIVDGMAGGLSNVISS